MSQWANEHPEQMAEIAALPPAEQNGALRAAIGYDPDRIRDQYEELHGSEATRGTPAGGLGREGLLKDPPVGPSSDHRCDVCEAPPGYHHLSYCDLRGEV